VYEALAVSEVFQLMEQNPSANVIINNDVEPEAAKAVQQHYPTLQITPQTTAADVLLEMARLPKKGAMSFRASGRKKKAVPARELPSQSPLQSCRRSGSQQCSSSNGFSSQASI
jgi:hypothetical protein